MDRKIQQINNEIDQFAVFDEEEMDVEELDFRNSLKIRPEIHKDYFNVTTEEIID